MGYITPCDAAITDTWQGHKNRNPPSQEPGTDYGAARGTPVRCAEAGTVVDLQSSPSGATGRYVTVNLDDGRRVRYLHLSQVTVGVGARVSRGQTIARSGASGFGSETGYGAHVHVSLWSSPGQSISNTIDFQQYVGNPTTPPQEEEDMNSEQDARLKFIENLLRVPNANYGWPEVTAQRAGDVQARIAVPNAGYDYLPAIVNQLNDLISKVNNLEAKVDAL